jgi:hypothetical protein
MVSRAVALGRRGGPVERKKALRSLLSPSLRANRGRRGVSVEAVRDVEGGVVERRRRCGRVMERTGRWCRYQEREVAERRG